MLFLVTACCSPKEVHAQTTDQNYPVTAQAFIAAQPNARLSTYFSSNTALMVNLLLKDLTKSSIQVYLKWSLDGPGVRVASQEGYIPAGLITLDRGVIVRLSGAQLQNDYFLAGAIEEQGLNGNPLRTSLPEGFYTFRVQALEAGTGREVSNIGETYFSITTPLPPIINIPFNGAELTMNQPQRVDIQWMPRHYRLPGNITSYDLKVCKVPDGYEPTEALDACVNPVIDDKGNPGTFYPGNTGIGNSIIGALERGARYAARVTVHEIDADGNEVVFANDGQSEVTWFRYGKPCVSPEKFTINESGPGRVQLGWDSQQDVDGYHVLYRKEGELKWTSQKVSAASATVTGLEGAKYEFAIQSVSSSGGCPVGEPENSQPYTVSGDEQDELDLPIALSDPMNLPVQASGCQSVDPGQLGDYYSNFPGAVGADTTNKLKIPGCALQSGVFTVCSPEHPSVALPAGQKLTSLSAGDVLGIYDFAVFVTEVSGSGAFSGRGLVRMPFMEGTLALAEFSGLKATTSGDGAGGCVYEAAEFKILSVSQAEVAAARSKLTGALAKRTDPAAYTGTLADALARYDSVPATAGAQARCSYQAAIVGATQQIKEALQQVLSDNPTPAVNNLIAKIDSLIGGLAGNSKVDSLPQKYQELISQIDTWKQERQQPGGGDGSTDPVYQIRNVRVNNITYQGAVISWEGPVGVSKYVIEYTDKDGAVLQETVQETQIDLARLRGGMQYNYKITAYKDNQAVASVEGAFLTDMRSVPRPENLQYVRIDEESVKITWDKNRLHDSYMLVYTDRNGVRHTVYPTDNAIVLRGLDPSQFYDYEVVAYDRARLASDPANARIASSEKCELGIVVQNARTTASLAGNVHILTIAGCIATPGTENPIAWSNGTAGISQTNGQIVFGDGEIAQISTGNTPLIGATRMLTVKPSKNTFYTATCAMGKGAATKICTYSVEVKVSSPDCGSRFAITVSSGQQTGTSVSVTSAAMVELKATGCDGDVRWSPGLGSGNELKLTPIKNMLVSAQCLKGENICYSNTVDIKVLPAETPEPVQTCKDKLLYSSTDPYTAAIEVYSYAGSFLLSDGIKDYNSTPLSRVSVPSLNVSNIYVATFPNGCKTSIQIPNKFEIVLSKNGSGIVGDGYDISAIRYDNQSQLRMLARTACNGRIVWTNDQDDSFESEGPWLEFGATPYPPDIHPYPSLTTTYYATCFANDGTLYQATNPKTLIVPSEECIVMIGKTQYGKGESVSLAVRSCVGNVQWEKDGKPFTNGRALEDVALKEAIYKATCDMPACSVSKRITVSGCGLVVKQTKLSERPGDDIILNATGCATKINWMDSDGTVVDAGAELRVSPRQTTSYKAVCELTDCSFTIEVEVPVIMPPLVVCENLSTQAQPAVIRKGELNDIVLTAAGCTDGTTIWNGPGLPTDTKGVGQEQQVIAKGVKDLAVYSVKCQKDVVGETEATIEVPAQIRLDLIAEPSSVEKGQKTTLIAEGCGGGLITWSGGVTKTCAAPCRVEGVVINVPSTFTATCVSGTETLAKQVKVSVKTPIAGPSGNDYTSVFGPDCASFAAYVYPSDRANAVDYPYFAGTKLKFETSNCNGGTVRWRLLEGGTVDILNESPKETTTYIAQCVVGGAVCAESVRTIDIVDFSCEDFSVAYEQVNGQFKFYPTWCVGTQTVKSITLFKNNGTTENLQIGGTNAYWPDIDDLNAIEFKCTPEMRYPDRSCYHTLYFSDNKIVRGQDKPYNEKFGTELSSERTSEGNNANLVDCQSQYPMSNLMGSYFDALVCNTIYQYQGVDNVLSEADAKSYLENLQRTLASDPAFSKYSFDFSAVTPKALAAAMLSETPCKTAGALLGKAVDGSESADTYNNVIRNTFPIINQKLLGEECIDPPTTIADAAPTTGRVAALEIDYNRYFIAPDGMAVKLPTGAVPKFSNFGGRWAAPPAGTLQGFTLADGREFFAEITHSPSRFVGYLLKMSPICEPREYYDKDLFYLPSGKNPVYYFAQQQGGGQCGYNWIEANYTFQPGSGRATIEISPELTGPYNNTTRFKECVEDGDWITGSDGVRRKTITESGSKFNLEDRSGNITVTGDWKAFSKCPECKQVAEQALQSALTKARAANGGKLSEQTSVIAKNTQNYGDAGVVEYADMKLGDILKNLAQTYNSLLDRAKVPTEAWEPGKQFYVRDETAVISGAIDQALEEATELPQLVGLGLTLASDPEGARKQLESFAQELDWEKAKEIAVEVARGAVFADEFEKGGKYARHATGRAGVVLAKTVATGGVLTAVMLAPSKLKKGTELLKGWIVDLSKVKLINGRFPINSQMYAGRKYSFDIDQNLPLQAKYAGEVPGVVKARIDALGAKYPNGVDFDELGFARFEPYTVMVNGREAKVTIQTSGSRDVDFAEADRLMGIDKIYRGENELTWHHVEDSKTMILVPFDIHDQVKHTGGIAVYKNDVSVEE
ncbi:fibronectin type III domain protein [Dyadobacter jiangsuensis]|uniref:Fibronectin type III domain protein n=2 Tax=Dyadobacter jiangsuensis TaxID=1591085 RepID=A0A2P8FPH2_9BACT|nr:fibronectin type III domain protein [Dyadobacter jiangsuensis]